MRELGHFPHGSLKCAKSYPREGTAFPHRSLTIPSYYRHISLILHTHNSLTVPSQFPQDTLEGTAWGHGHSLMASLTLPSGFPQQFPQHT